MVQVKQCIFSPEEVAALYATPAIVLPKPPAGFINNILGITHKMTYGSAPYSGGSEMIYGSNNGTSVFTDSGVLSATGDYNLPALKTASGQAIFSANDDFMVTTDAAASAGDSTINVYIIFEQVQIGV